MKTQDCVRVYNESPHTGAVQFRFTCSFVHASLIFDETRNLARILTEMSEAAAPSPARSYPFDLWRHPECRLTESF
jgi:hypothetical protein